MMEKPEDIVTTIKVIGAAIGNAVKTKVNSNKAKQQNNLIMQEQVCAMQTIARERATGEIARTGIDEIVKTQFFITQQHLEGRSLEYANGLMYQLYNEYSNELANYKYER